MQEYLLNLAFVEVVGDPEDGLGVFYLGCQGLRETFLLLDPVLAVGEFGVVVDTEESGLVLMRIPETLEFPLLIIGHETGHWLKERSSQGLGVVLAKHDESQGISNKGVVNCFEESGQNVKAQLDTQALLCLSVQTSN